MDHDRSTGEVCEEFIAAAEMINHLINHAKLIVTFGVYTVCRL